jgi:hypothetical protein
MASGPVLPQHLPGLLLLLLLRLHQGQQSLLAAVVAVAVAAVAAAAAAGRRCGRRMLVAGWLASERGMEWQSLLMEAGGWLDHDTVGISWLANSKMPLQNAGQTEVSAADLLTAHCKQQLTAPVLVDKRQPMYNLL